MCRVHPEARAAWLTPGNGRAEVIRCNRNSAEMAMQPQQHAGPASSATTPPVNPLSNSVPVRRYSAIGIQVSALHRCLFCPWLAGSRVGSIIASKTKTEPDIAWNGLLQCFETVTHKTAACWLKDAGHAWNDGKPAGQ